MRFTSKLTPEQWAEARHLRAEGASFQDLGDRFGLCRSTIAQRARKEAWPSLTVPARLPAPVRAKPRRAAPASASTPVAPRLVRRSLKPRLMNVMDIQIQLTELRMQQQLKNAHDARDAGKTVPGTLEDGDKVFRHVATAGKTIEQLTETAPERASPIRRGAISTAADASAADAFRREIAERIEKLIPPS